MTPILQVRKVTKNFPPNVVALRGVDLEMIRHRRCRTGWN